MSVHPYVPDEMIALDHQGHGRCTVCGLPPTNSRFHGEIVDTTAARYEVDRDEARQ